MGQYKVNSTGNYSLKGWELTINAIEWVGTKVNKDSTILELGSGHSTKEFSEFCNVVSVEQDLNWVGKYDSTYIHAPIVNGWYDINVLKKGLPKKYDVLVIDGPIRIDEADRRLFNKHKDLFYLDCPILLDDVHRIETRVFAKELAKSLNRIYKEIDIYTAVIE